MKYVYFKPELRNLSQGERIAFVRQFRRLTQDNVSEKLGITGENKRRTMTRYERGERSPKSDRLLELSKILNVNINCIREYDFTKTEDIIYFLLLDSWKFIYSVRNVIEHPENLKTTFFKKNELYVKTPKIILNNTEYDLLELGEKSL